MVSIESNRYDEDRDESMISKTDANKARLEGKKLYEEMPTDEAVRERDLLIKKLDTYDKKAGVDTKKFREQLRKHGNKPRALKEIKEKLDKVAISEYFRRVKHHEAFNAEGKLGQMLRKEMLDLHKSFIDLHLMKGSFSKIDILMNLDDTLEPKAAFARKYDKQTPYVKELYEQSMGELKVLSLQYPNSKEVLLKKVLKVVGELEDSPQAIQKEFKERAKKIKNPDKLRVEKAKLISEYADTEKAYEKGLKEYAKYYGGNTSEEFMEYIRSRGSLKEMKRVLSLLPEYNKERKEEHEKIEELLSYLPKKKAERFWNIINKLGLSERKAYRKENIEPAVQTENYMVAEFEGELLAAHQDRFPLYTADEKFELASRFKSLDLKAQKQFLFVEKLNIQYRQKIVTDYEALPLSVKNDIQFYKANSIKRTEILRKAQREIEASNAGSAFAELADGEILDNERVRDITGSLDSHEGSDLLEEAFEDQVSEADRRNLKSVLDFTNAKAGIAIKAKKKGMNQEEAWIDDYVGYKEGLSQGDEKRDASQEEDWLKASKIREAQSAKHLYKKGIVTHVGSNMEVRQDVKKDDLTNLKGDRIRDAMARSRYVETDTHVLSSDESEPNSVAELLGDALEEIAIKMAREMAEGLADKINAKGSNRAMLVNSLNSARNIGTLKDQFYDNEMSSAANNLRHYSKKSA